MHVENNTHNAVFLTHIRKFIHLIYEYNYNYNCSSKCKIFSEFSLLIRYIENYKRM